MNWQHMHPLENEVELEARLGYHLSLLKQRALHSEPINYPAVFAYLREASPQPPLTASPAKPTILP